MCELLRHNKPSMARQLWVGGNFKMNGTRDSLQALLAEFNKASLDPAAGAHGSGCGGGVGENVSMLTPVSPEVVVFPPALYLDLTRSALRKDIAVGVQNCYKAESGAFTGEIR